jgi:hypothetical protein
MTPQTLAPASAHARLIHGLVDTLTTERRLVDELTDILIRQRDAIARDDVQALDDSVFALQRVLLTLGEARGRRRTLIGRLGGEEDTAPALLADTLGTRCTPDVRDAAMALDMAARNLSREVGVNQQVLRQGLAAGEEFLRRLAALIAPAPAGYTEPAHGATTPAAGFLNVRG